MCIIISGKTPVFNVIIYSVKYPCFLYRFMNMIKQAYNSCLYGLSTVYTVPITTTKQNIYIKEGN